MSQKIVAAAVHAAPVYMSKSATLEKVVELIKKAKQDSISLLAFPETFVPGYPYFIDCYPANNLHEALAEYVEQSVVVASSDLFSVQAACRENEISICLGISERITNGHTIFISQVFIDRCGNIAGVHRKLQPTSVERMLFAQGGGHTLRTYDTLGSCRVGGLCCFEHTMNLARQALIEDLEEIHIGAWPALSAMKGPGARANDWIESMMKNHALTAQVFVVISASPVDDGCLEWMEKHLGSQNMVKRGGGWSTILHPYCTFMAGPHVGVDEKLIKAEIDLKDINRLKLVVDSSGHYKRPEVLQLSTNQAPLWADDEALAKGFSYRHHNAVDGGL